MKEIIIKINEKINIFKQIQLSAIIISTCIILLFFNIIGKDNSINVVYNYIKPNTAFFVVGIMLSFLLIYFIRKIKDLKNRIWGDIFNASLLNFSITMSFISVIDKKSLDSDFSNYTIYILFFILLFFVKYLKEILELIDIEINRNN